MPLHIHYATRFGVLTPFSSNNVFTNKSVLQTNRNKIKRTEIIYISILVFGNLYPVVSVNVSNYYFLIYLILDTTRRPYALFTLRLRRVRSNDVFIQSPVVEPRFSCNFRCHLWRYLLLCPNTIPQQTAFLRLSLIILHVFPRRSPYSR